MSMFFDREQEIRILEKVANSKKAELVLMYGRRRVGKSRILTEFAKRHEALYLLADLSKNILDILSRQIKEEYVRFKDWDDFFEFLLKSKYEIVIIDEFQYLVKINKAWPSQLQRWWERIKDTEKKMILCGSIISTIYKIAKGYGSPLYGRKTYELQVFPLNFSQVKNFLPKYSIEELIEAYSVVGGVPRYLEELDPNKSVKENIREKILNRNSFLYNEPLNLLFEEFRDPSPYVSIILAIVQGYVRFNEISSYSRIDVNKLPKYLLILERIGLIEKEIPVTERKIKTKFTRYKIKDNFYRFWFKFVFGNRNLIERGLESEVLEEMEEEFNSYVGRVFEEVCEEVMVEKNIFDFTKIGRWWHKDKEIDIVALNEKRREILFAECKWKDRVNAQRITEELSEKIESIDWEKKEREEYFTVFAKSFSKKINEFEGRKVFCFDLRDLEKIIFKKLNRVFPS